MYGMKKQGTGKEYRRNIIHLKKGEWKVANDDSATDKMGCNEEEDALHDEGKDQKGYRSSLRYL